MYSTTKWNGSALSQARSLLILKIVSEKLLDMIANAIF
ncbi:hypothetical protein SAMN06296036_106216 [Pseudobacteriovorax antillogorgiicola]|uniref:Uncharacterized protein n=1 Tax=Pseudobacteriovorax antillogorgiicola TaxID=1513793 RepID=A0A1Y6BME8_9BACT|nr:hypothetical protein EDD56_10627 [Pseudobacteriovorax antillogorgiicola]SMF18925.1 hypothetical protein SAMN06296036_106216 [Pseudobacteriovorax antillogorgiicola]